MIVVLSCTLGDRGEVPAAMETVVVLFSCGSCLACLPAAKVPHRNLRSTLVVLSGHWMVLTPQRRTLILVVLSAA